MAAHVRTQIRDAIKVALAGLATSEERVFGTRAKPLAESELPALIVKLGHESISTETVDAPGLQLRDIAVSITAIAQANDGVDDLLDQMAAEVQPVIIAAFVTDSLGGLVQSLDLVDIDEVEIDSEARVATGRLVMTWSAQYFTRADDPTTVE